VAKTKILIVDDEASEALQVLQKDPVDLILTDYMMPEMNGLELTRRVKENPAWARTKVVLFSVSAEPVFQERAKELGALDYLPKMNGAGAIVTRIYELLGPERESLRSALTSFPAGSVLRTSADMDLLSQQIRTIAEGIVDFIHLARLSDELSPGTSYALDSAEAMAQELHRLAAALEAGVVRFSAPGLG
jgi:CheY-like chemotaxis protein